MALRKKLLASTMIITISASLLNGCSSSTNTTNITTSNQSKEIVYNDLFKENEVMDIKIEIPEDDWNDMKENAKDEKYHSANITVGNTKLENIGIRTKGFSSLQLVSSNESDRYSFRIKLDKYVNDQNLNGLNEFVLNNNFQDPSYMREYVSYKVLEQLGVDVPKTAYSNVYINGELFGFYLAIEAVDDSFVERISDSNATDVKLYKAEGDHATLVDEDSLSNFELKSGEDDSMAGLKKLVSALNSIKDGQKGDIESVFDVDAFLKSIAINTVVGNYDSYSGSKAHNYFLLEEDGVFKYIPWDYNMAFGGYMEDGGASVTVSIDEPIYGVDASKRPLITKLLSVDEYKEKYYGYLNELVTYFDDFENTVSELSSFIKPYVENDPSAFYTIEQYEQNITTSDTDLSKIENKIPSGGGKFSEGMKIPDGMDFTKGEKPEGIPNMPDGMDFTKGEMPEGMKIPNGMDFSKGQMPEGMEMPKMGLSENVVSIMDYLTQRIANIKTQLS